MTIAAATRARVLSATTPHSEALIGTHHELGDEQSAMINVRLILLLANHIGDIGVLRQAMQAARQGV